MRATIEHESRGRMRLRLRQKNMTLRQADLLEAWLKGQPGRRMPWFTSVLLRHLDVCGRSGYGALRHRQLHLG